MVLWGQLLGKTRFCREHSTVDLCHQFWPCSGAVCAQLRQTAGSNLGAE